MIFWVFLCAFISIWGAISCNKKRNSSILLFLLLTDLIICGKPLDLLIINPLTVKQDNNDV